MTDMKRVARTRAPTKTPAAKRATTRTAVKAPVAETSLDATAKPKQKLVRDSFTIPKAEYVVLEGLKLRAADLKRPTKKSEVLRAGIAALRAMSDKAFLAALTGVPSLKTGRPKAAQGNKSAKNAAPRE